MALLLADDPTLAAALLACSPSSGQVEIDPSSRALWDTLGGAQAPCALARDDDFWRLGLVVRDAASSQYDLLRGLLAGDLALPGPLFTVALAGRGFHGQRERVWATAPGNLHLCAALPPAGLPAADALALTVLPAVAAVDAVVAAGGGVARPGIRWVNDVMIEGRKVGGVLSATQSLAGRVGWSVFGIGLNVAVSPAAAPSRFTPAVDCLARCLPSVTLRAVLAALLVAMAGRWRQSQRNGVAPLLAAYRGASVVIGREVAVWSDEDESRGDGLPGRLLARGVVRAINADLSLALAGREEPVRAGRLILEG